MQVVSRFQGELAAFKKGLTTLGFKVTHEDSKNTHFFLLDAIKVYDIQSVERALPPLKACQYKKR